MEFVGTDTVPFRGLLELINMHKPELLKIVDVETLYSLDILQGKPCVIDGNFEFLSFNLNTAQGRRDRFLAGKTTWGGQPHHRRAAPTKFYSANPGKTAVLQVLP